MHTQTAETSTKRETKKAREARERMESMDYIRKLLESAHTRGGSPIVYTILRHVSRSGMMRHISLVVNTKSEGLTDITWHVAKILRYPITNGPALKVGGCGMDMGFSVVYNLSAALYGHQERGGYRLRHEWL